MDELKKADTVYLFFQYSQQPPYNTMLRYHNWGKHLVDYGYKVIIICSSVVHNTDIDVIEKEGSQYTECSGVGYYYIKTPMYTGNSLKRIKNMLAYCFGIATFAKEYPDPDIIVANGAYIFPFVKSAYKKLPIILDITDLWPLSIVEYTGIGNSNPVIKMLYIVEKQAYIKSDAIIFSIEGGKDYVNEQKYRDKVNGKKIFHINMGCDIDEFDKNRATVQPELTWDMSKFNLVYCGSIREANEVREICDTAIELSNRGYNNIEFQIYGNGDQLDELIAYTKDNHIDSVHFFGRIEKSKIPYILSKSKANIMTYKQVHLMKYGGSQSKLFDYLASSRPLICNANWGYSLIERYNCGVIAKNQTATALADVIEQLYKMSDIELDEMGKRGRKAADMCRSEILARRLCDVFDYVNIEKKERLGIR